MAMPQSRSDLDQIIEQQVKHAIGAPQIEAIGRLVEFFGKFDELTLSFGVVKSELATIKSQLEGVLPQLERSTLAAVAELEGKAKGIDSKLTSSIESLEKRDKEVSDKLKATFAQIDSQIESVQLQGSTVQSIQEGVHGVVVKQQQDMEKMRVDVERYLIEVTETIASRAAPQSQGGQPFQPRGDGGPRLNDARSRRCPISQME